MNKHAETEETFEKYNTLFWRKLCLCLSETSKQLSDARLLLITSMGKSKSSARRTGTVDRCFIPDEAMKNQTKQTKITATTK